MDFMYIVCIAIVHNTAHEYIHTLDRTVIIGKAGIQNRHAICIVINTITKTSIKFQNTLSKVLDVLKFSWDEISVVFEDWKPCEILSLQKIRSSYCALAKKAVKRTEII